jgi:hypothetical protein
MDPHYSVPPPPLLPKPARTRRAKALKILVICVGVVLVCGLGVWLCIAMFRGPSQAMSAYTDALIRKDYQGGYFSASPEFRAGSSFADLVKVHDKLSDRLGALKSVKQTYWHIESENGRTVSTIQADFNFERGSLTFEFELHKEAGIWRVFSYKEL